MSGPKALGFGVRTQAIGYCVRTQFPWAASGPKANGSYVRIQFPWAESGPKANGSQHQDPWFLGLWFLNIIIFIVIKSINIKIIFFVINIIIFIIIKSINIKNSIICVINIIIFIIINIINKIINKFEKKYYQY